MKRVSMKLRMAVGVLEAVVERPVSGKGMKQIVLDFPPAMGYMPVKLGRHLRNGQGCCPPPMVYFLHLHPLVIFSVSFG